MLPPKSYALTGERLGVELQAEGKSLAQLEIRAGEVADGITPFMAVGLLADWERMLSLSPDSSMTLQQRCQQVLARINATGGLSRTYFINLAKSLGYRVTIDEPEPFLAGSSVAGEKLLTFGQNLIEGLFKDLKPARTQEFLTREKTRP
ncbi:putative phage tail protein [Sodalis glossinidius]|uniref:putative phage tail protein n=1 Tax=Sodalis glossinidius TaxID=63612 RepID=UPI001FB1E232|nr:putative phage tail protein [Sodalis glossinidius]